MVDFTTKITEQLFCSGFGQYHTDSKGEQLESINWDCILNLVDNPQETDKSQSQWLIPSTLLTRSLSSQKDNGQYWILWADIDDNPPTVNKLAEHLIDLWCDYEIYTSRSATSEKQKSRILIPLEQSLNCDDWRLAQECFNDFVDQIAITDKAALNPNQLLYLPNKGEFYSSESSRGGSYLDPISYFSKEIAAKKKTIAQQQAETVKRLKNAELKRVERKFIGFASPIDEFNSLYPIEQILLNEGYEQRGDKFNSPESESKGFAGSVKDGRYHTLSTSDPLYSNGKGAVDAYGAFTIFKHGGDEGAAFKDITDGDVLAIGVESWNKVKRREYTQAQASDSNFSDIPINLPPLKLPTLTQPQHSIMNQLKPTQTPQFSLEQFVISDIEGMKAMLKNDNWVIDRIALEGQITIIFAAPNSGKTLLTIKLLIDAVIANRLDGKNIYYLNCDDTMKGLTTKAELCGKHGINMLAAGYNGFKNAYLISMLDAMAKQDSAKGKILILDTLKKFSDLMNKKDSSDFNESMRAFVAKGGTVIALGHVNKARDADGKVIHQGTTDSVDDADCAYTLDVINQFEDSFQGKKIINRTVVFENFKARGDNIDKISYLYKKRDGGTYEDLLNSVKLIDEHTAEKAEQEGRINNKLTDHAEEIELVLDAIASGTNTTEVIVAFLMNEGISRAKAKKVLKEHTGDNLSLGHRWQKEKGDKNQRIFKRLC